MDHTIDYLGDEYRQALKRHPALTVDPISDPEGRAWRIDGPTTAIQINKKLTYAERVQAFREALARLDFETGHPPARVPLRVVPRLPVDDCLPATDPEPGRRLRRQG